MAQAISVRVPWHDDNWNGNVCQNPAHNNACTILKRIAEQRDGNDNCERHCGKGREEWADDFTPPCLRESGVFLSDKAHSYTADHPFCKNEKFRHVLPTTSAIPPNSFTAIPYAWFLKPESEITDSPHNLYYTGFKLDKESLSFHTIFISNGMNQKKILDRFWKDVEPDDSLVIAYAKSVPFTEVGDRVIVALTAVKSLGPLAEYSYSQKPDGKNRYEAWLWERSIQHKLADGDPVGFVVPFKQIEAYKQKNTETDINDLLLFAPNAYRREFSYGCEHISPDALILTLNRAIELIRIWRQLGFRPENKISWEDQIEWLEGEVERAWKERGPYPGLAAVLTALGVPLAFEICQELRRKYPGAELWEKLPEIFSDKEKLKEFLPKESVRTLKSLTVAMFEDISDLLEAGSQFLKILARIDLTVAQAQIILNPCAMPGWQQALLKRLAPLLKWDDETLMKKLIENPYILYEETRLMPLEYQIGINQMDLAFFPPEEFADQWFDENDVRIEDPDDKRRIRALITSFLEKEAEKGSTFMPQDKAKEYCARFRPDMPGMDLQEVVLGKRFLEKRKDSFEPLFVLGTVDLITPEGHETGKMVQLSRLRRTDDIIRDEITKRLEQKPLVVNDDWRELLLHTESDPSEASLKEQTIALEKMAASTLSVLTGGAGTGKTTTLSILCHNEKIRKGRILILAPTGKARLVFTTRLRKAGIEHEAKTVFQFLKSQKACDTYNYRYYSPHDPAPRNIPATVIIDESSMLTEEMFAALLQSLQHAKRIIFAGDPNQLPPIGAGKPFFELCGKLEHEPGQPHYAFLSIRHRNKGLGADIAELFKTNGKSLDAEEMEAILKKDDPTFKLIKCEKPDEIESKLLATLSEIFTDLKTNEKLASWGVAPSEKLRFDVSLGGRISRGGKFINFDQLDFSGEDKNFDNWQILTPWHNNENYGARAMNALIHDKYGIDQDRGSGISKHETKQEYGSEYIHYGEKVINRQNKTWKENDIYSVADKDKSSCLCHTANGEMGIVAYLSGCKYSPKKGCNVNTHHEVQFSSQPGYRYKYPSGPGGEDSDSPLELGYALTIHKAQGSGFKYTILLLMDESERPSPFLSREMLYTALTRQEEKLVVITNKNPEDLLKYADNSELQNRLTNLFDSRIIALPNHGWHDERCVHRAKDGQKLRSKSELVIYNEMLNAGLTPVYEHLLEWENGKAIPDFMLEGKDGPIYWEHLGMLGNAAYKAHWEKKKRLYAEHGISVENGNLVISCDDIGTGALDSEKITNLVEELKTRL